MDFDTFFIMTMFIPSSVFTFICVSQWLIICLCNKPVSDVLFIFVYHVLFFDCRMMGTYISRISSCTQLSSMLITQATSPHRPQRPHTPALRGLSELPWGSGEPSPYSPREANPYTLSQSTRQGSGSSRPAPPETPVHLTQTLEALISRSHPASWKDAHASTPPHAPTSLPPISAPPPPQKLSLTQYLNPNLLMHHSCSYMTPGSASSVLQQDREEGIGLIPRSGVTRGPVQGS